MNSIKTENLSFKYKGGTTFNFPDVEIKTRELWLLTGNSGSGKTTLLHLLAGILSPQKGNINISNTNISKLKQAQLDTFRVRHIGLVFQKNYFIEALNMQKNLVYFANLSGLKVDEEHLQNLLSTLKIKHLSHKKPAQLSSGELQRFSIARGLINKPGILLADEPTSSLDDDNCQRFIKMLITVCDTYKISLIVATHDARLKSEFTNTLKLK